MADEKPVNVEVSPSLTTAENNAYTERASNGNEIGQLLKLCVDTKVD